VKRDELIVVRKGRQDRYGYRIISMTPLFNRDMRRHPAKYGLVKKSKEVA